MNEEYLLQLYKYISDNDTSYKNDVSFDSFRSDMSDSQYASQIYGYLNDLDSTFSDDVSVIDFIKDINTDPKQIKKKDTVVEGTSPMEPMDSTLPQAEADTLLVSEEPQEPSSPVDSIINSFTVDLESLSPEELAPFRADESLRERAEIFGSESLIFNNASKEVAQSKYIQSRAEETAKDVQNYYAEKIKGELNNNPEYAKEVGDIEKKYYDVIEQKTRELRRKVFDKEISVKEANDFLSKMNESAEERIALEKYTNPITSKLLDETSKKYEEEWKGSLDKLNARTEDLVKGIDANSFWKPLKNAIIGAYGTSMAAFGGGADVISDVYNSNFSPDYKELEYQTIIELAKIAGVDVTEKIKSTPRLEMSIKDVKELVNLRVEVKDVLGKETYRTYFKDKERDFFRKNPEERTALSRAAADFMDSAEAFKEMADVVGLTTRIQDINSAGDVGDWAWNTLVQLGSQAGMSAATGGGYLFAQGMADTYYGALEKAAEEHKEKTGEDLTMQEVLDLSSAEMAASSATAGIAMGLLEKLGLDTIVNRNPLLFKSLVEGGTEFFQTWIQEIGERVGLDRSFKDVGEVIRDPEILNESLEATAAGVFGGGAGGALSSIGRTSDDLKINTVAANESLANKIRNKVLPKPDGGKYRIGNSFKTRKEINDIIDNATTAAELEPVVVMDDQGIEDKLTSKYNQLKDAVQEQETGDVPITEQAEGVQEVETEVREPSIQEKRQKIEQRRQEELEPVMSAMAASEQTGEVPVVNGELVNKETLDDINAKYDVELDALQETRPIEETSKVSDALGSTVFIDNKKGTLKIDETEGAGKKVIFESEDGTQIRDIGDIDVVGNRPIGDLNLKQETGTVQEQTSPSVEGETVINTEGDVVTSPEGVQGGAQKPATFLRERRDGSIVVKDERGLQRTIKGEKAQQFNMRFPDAKKGDQVRFQLSEDLETTPQDVGKLKNLARKVEKAISQITEGVPIIVPDTQQDYDNLIDSLSKSAEEKAMLKSANGFYDSSTKTAYINPSQATDTTIVHEAVHGLMSDALGSWKKADKVTNELWRTIRKNADNPELISQLEAFAEMYVQDGKMVQSSEAFSELMGILSSSEQTLNQKQRNAIQKFFDELMSFLGLKRMTVDETFELVDTLAARLASGDMITASDMAPLQRQTLVDSIRNNNTVDNFIEATKTRLQGLFKMVYSEADRMKYLKDNGFLREVDNLSEFVGMDGTMVFPDDMLVGQGFLDGKQIFYGQGGLFFVTNTGDVWAVKGGANRIINSLNEQIDKQGKGYLFLVKGRSEKILNSAAGASNASKILIDFASKNLFSKADVKSSLFSAINSVNDSKKVKELNKKVTLKEMGLNPNSSATEVLEGMKNYFDRNTTVSFDVRGTIIQNMLGNLVKSKNTNASKIIEILGGDPEYKLNKNATAQNPNGIIDLVSKLMSEDVLKGLKTQDVYAAVEVSSKVKQAKPDDAHKSYGTHIRTVDGSRPVLTLIKSTPNANKVFKKKTGKEITMAIGEDKSTVTVVDDGTRQQRAKTEIKKTLESSKDFEIFTTRNKIPMSKGLKGVLRNIKGLRSINLENVKVPLLKDPVSLVIGNPNVGISIGELLNYYRRSLLSAKKFFTKDLFRAGELKDAFIAKQASIVEQNISRLNRKMKEIKATSDDLVELDLFMRGLPNKLNEDLAPLATEMRSQIDKLSEILIANGWVAESREYVIEEISNDSGEYFAIDTGTGKRVKLSQAQINQLESNDKAPMEGETVNILSSVKNNLGEYLTRSYKIFDDKNWKDKVGTVIVQRAKNLYREQLRSVAERVQPRATKDRMRSELLPEYTNDDGTIRDQELTQAIENEYSKLTPAQISEEINSTLEKMVDNKIDEILGTSEEKSFMKKGKMGSKDLSILKERNDIPLEIRMLMGEYTDPLQNYARTILKQSALVANQRFLETSRQMGLGKFFFESGQPRPRGFDFQIAAEGSETMSPLNGLYTTKEIFEQFSQAADSMPQWLEYWMKPITVVKWVKTIGSFTTHIKNFTGNFGFMAANGHWDLREMGGAYKIIKNDLLSKTNVELNEMMNEYIEAGLVKQSAGLNEIRAMFKDANFDEATERILSKKPSKLGKVKKFLEDVYGSTDDMFKIVAYENEMSRYSKAIYGKDKSQLTNAERDSLKSEVADIVKNTYPTYSRVPELIQMIRRFPAVGNFVSFQAESWRTAYNIINIASKEIKSDNPAIKKIGFQRLAGVVAYTSIKDAIIGYTSYSAGMGLSGLFGSLFDDDEEKEKDRALRRYVAEWSKNSDLIILESKDGDLRYIDVSASDPFGGIAKVFNAFSNGENIMDATLDGLYAAIEPFIGTDIATNTFLQIKNNDNGYGGRIYNPEDPNAFNKALDKVIKTFQPGTATSVRRFIDAENKLEEAAAQLLGLRTYTNDLNQSFTFKLTGEDGYRQRIRDSKSLSRERYDKNATLPEVLEGEERKKQALKLIYADLNQDFVAAIKLGASPLKLIAKMKDLGLSKEDIVNVIISSSED